MAIRIQMRRDTAANWTSANPVLASAEIGYETDTGKFKWGNGSSTWTVLSYATTGSGGGTVVDATDTAKGIVELATTAETTAGTDATRAVTPVGVKAVGDTKAPLVSAEGIVFHNGTTGGGTRPSGYARVRWVNPVGTTYNRPTNMVSGDIWEHDA